MILGYISYIVLGWILLSLPFAQHGPGATALDNLFTTTSAISTTGLVTVSVSGSYNIFGQLIILILIQLGGIGYMTFSSFIILSRKRTLSDKRTEIANVVFSLPPSFRIDKFLRSVISLPPRLKLPEPYVFILFSDRPDNPTPYGAPSFTAFHRSARRASVYTTTASNHSLTTSGLI